MRLSGMIPAGIIAVGLFLVSGSNTVTASSPAKPSVKLVCTNAPCSSDGQTKWHGTYVVSSAHGFPANTAYVVTATYPKGAAYSRSNYSNGGTLFGVYGSIGTTDGSGKLPGFKWAANNGSNKPTDPYGTYQFQIRVKVHGKLKLARTSLVMHKLR